jgi:S-DNA-T family DNA segregation ATPase FtsK/SpoIIIE
VLTGATSVVAGPARSGRSSVLAVIASAVTALDPATTVFSVGPRPGPLARCTIAPATPGEVAGWVERVLAGRSPQLVLVDDADALDGPSFERLAAARGPTTAFVIAGTADGLRSIGHWSRPLLRTRTGVLLAPTAADGDLVRAAVPARPGRSAPGHGYLAVDGELVPIRAARPDGIGEVAA